ncbi:MAG: hypothetical protein POH28_13870, partial [Acidocella sp.]|nr:hypothetical protein [Acidocella sp.]
MSGKTALMVPHRALSASDRPSAVTMQKVAAPNLIFWVIKTAITSAGDISGDVLSLTLRLGYVA